MSLCCRDRGLSSPGHPLGHQLNGEAREVHRRLAAVSLGRERRTIRVPANVDLGYLRFRQELKERLTGQGDEWIWSGLVMQDDPRLWPIEEVDEVELMDG